VWAQPPDASGGADSAALLALGTAEDDATARLRAGEATSLVLVTATALGMATCPMTEPLELTATRDAIHTEVFGLDAFPQMLIRVGPRLSAAPPQPIGVKLSKGQSSSIGIAGRAGAPVEVAG
jgi:hypothetical protein